MLTFAKVVFKSHNALVLPKLDTFLPKLHSRNDFYAQFVACLLPLFSVDLASEKRSVSLKISELLSSMIAWPSKIRSSQALQRQRKQKASQKRACLVEYSIKLGLK